MNPLELIQYLLDTVEDNQTLIAHVRDRYPSGPIRDMKLAELRSRVRADLKTIDMLSSQIVATAA
jgi:hypothetical protein